jgi:hypothetical protein
VSLLALMTLAVMKYCKIADFYSGAAAKIPTQANALSRYGSYTYNIGLYILKPEQYNTYITSKRITIPNGQLLMASGGAPLSANSQPPTNNNMQTGSAANRPGVDLAAGRSQYFPLDYYIDDVKLKGIINGKGSRSAHNIFEVILKLQSPMVLACWTIFTRPLKKSWETHPTMLHKYFSW